MTEPISVFAIPSELEMLRESAQGFLAQKWPADRAVAASSDPAAIRQIWTGIAEQGWLALGTDSESGGMRAVLVVQEELGRAGCSAPLLDGILCNVILSGIADAPAELSDVQTRLQAGEAVVSCALGQHDGDSNAGAVTIRKTGNAARIDGSLAFVEGASIATHYLVADASAEVAIVSADEAGLAVSPTPGLGVPPLAELVLKDVPAHTATCDNETISTIRPLLRLGLVARALGAASRGFDLANDYAKVRVQFGKKIGQFQAIQHKLANCLIGLETSRLAAWRAAIAYDRQDPNWRYAASVAFAVASPALRQVCLETHHAFGGVSFWHEHEMPRHFRRIHTDTIRCGGMHGARADIADYLLDKAG